jgi:hypothetical protein
MSLGSACLRILRFDSTLSRATHQMFLPTLAAPQLSLATVILSPSRTISSKAMFSCMEVADSAHMVAPPVLMALSRLEQRQLIFDLSIMSGSEVRVQVTKACQSVGTGAQLPTSIPLALATSGPETSGMTDLRLIHDSPPAACLNYHAI